MPSGIPTRRRFPSTSGGCLSVALAGCSALSRNDDTDPTFTPTDADAVLTDATPEIERPVPVVPTADALEFGLERVDTLLADVPNSLGNYEDPDDTARRVIGDRRDEARDARDEAAAATGLLTRPSIGRDVLAETLQSLAETDERVREAATDDPGRSSRYRPNTATTRDCERNSRRCPTWSVVPSGCGRAEHGARRRL